MKFEDYLKARIVAKAAHDKAGLEWVRKWGEAFEALPNASRTPSREEYEASREKVTKDELSRMPVQGTVH